MSKLLKLLEMPDLSFFQRRISDLKRPLFFHILGVLILDFLVDVAFGRRPLSSEGLYIACAVSFLFVVLKGTDLPISQKTYEE